MISEKMTAALGQTMIVENKAGGAGHSFTNPAADSRGMQGFYYHEATDRRSWSAMIELFNETLK